MKSSYCNGPVGYSENTFTLGETDLTKSSTFEITWNPRSGIFTKNQYNNVLGRTVFVARAGLSCNLPYISRPLMFGTIGYASGSDSLSDQKKVKLGKQLTATATLFSFTEPQSTGVLCF